MPSLTERDFRAALDLLGAIGEASGDKAAFARHGLLVSFVLNRSRRDFSDRERALLDLLQPHLARLYRRATALNRLTARESEVLNWIAQGKSDAQIGAILGVSARTVQKHLQSVYAKLGVENRTAAVMR